MTSKFNPPPLERLAEVDCADCLYQADPVEIEGVVSAEGQAGWFHPDGYTVHFMKLTQWRRPQMPLICRELTLLRPVDEESDWLSEYPKLSIHRFQVLLSQDETRAILIGESSHAADPAQLMDVANELAQPFILDTERFGELTLDRSLNRFEGYVDWNENEIRLCIDADEDLDISAALRVAEKLWEEERLWKQRVDEYAVQELLSVKNECWLEDDESPLTADDFKSRMTLESIVIHPDGEFEFWHDDGDLFLCHSIAISGTLAEGLTQADIAG